jgi:hypothetical protein
VQNHPRAVRAFMFSLSALGLVHAAGCARQSFGVEVPHGYSGFVHIFCGPTVGFPSQPVRVNSLGAADASSCPGRDAGVKVIRDGQTANVTDVSWERNIDGSPVALSFNVK